MVFRADFHTHSTASLDGGLTEAHYEHMLASGRLDFVAVTDHNTIDMAVKLHAIHGSKVIIGEEITTLEGEIIGLFLSQAIPGGLALDEAIRQIKAQGGLVYAPHPFETVRNGLNAETMERIAEQLDIIEVHNGRAVFQNKSKAALKWAASHKVPGAAGSDAHGKAGWGRTYSVISEIPTVQSLPALLVAAAYAHKHPGLRGILYPKFNKATKWRRHA